MAETPIRVALTAGFNGSPQAMALLQLLERDGHEVAGVLLVKSLQAKRAKEIVRRGGRAALAAAGKRLLRSSREADGPIASYFKANQLRSDGIAAIAKASSVPLARVDSLNSDTALTTLASWHVDGVIFCGGGILRQPFLDASKGRVLNAHAGPMPEVRGMNAAEWTVLLGLRREITIHYIDQGIDTGPIVSRHPLGELPRDLETLREQPIVAAIDGLREAVRHLRGPMAPVASDAAAYPQYYTLAPLLRARLADRLAGPQ